MSTDPQPPLAEAINHLNAGRLAEADALCAEVLKHWPGQPFALYLSAVSANRRGDHRRAVEMAAASLAADSSNAECLVEKAAAHLALKEADAGQEACHRAIALSPTIQRAHYILSEFQMPGEDYTRILERLHRWLKPRTYLEIGTVTGATLALANPPTVVVGVDPKPSLSAAARTPTKLFPLRSDDYFATRDLRADLEGNGIDLAFIGAEHLYEQALRDFINVERHSNGQTVFLLHNGLPVDRTSARREQQTSFWSGDVWKVIATLRKYRPDLNVFTIATKPTGLGVVTGLDAASTVLADNFDRIVGEIRELPLPAGEAERRALLQVVDCDWGTIQARLSQRRTPAEEAPRPVSVSPDAPVAVPSSPYARRPRILFIVDLPNWAHDFKTTNIINSLKDSFDLTKVYTATLTEEDIRRADIVVIYYWHHLYGMPNFIDALRGKLMLFGICSHAELGLERREIGLPILRAAAAAVFVHNLILYDEAKELLDKPIYLCQNGVDTDFYCPQGERAAQAGSLTVGWAGSLTNHGNIRGYHDIIVPAVEQTPGVTLLTAAREDKWRGPEEMRDFYRSLDAYLVASREEGTPNPGLESAACGVPVISTRVGNMPELIRDGENGFLIDRTVEALAAALVRMRDDAALRRNMARQMRLDILAWDWKARAERFRTMFHETLARYGLRGEDC